MPGVVWNVTGATAWGLLALQAAGIWLTLRSAGILDVRELAATEERDPQRSVGREGHARTTRRFPLAREQLFHISERLPIEASARDGNRRLAAWRPFRIGVGNGGAKLVVGEVNEPVLGKLRMQRHLVETAVAQRWRDRWNAGNWLRIENRRFASFTGGIADDAEFRGANHHERIAVRKEGQTERMRESADDRRHADPSLLGCVEGVRRLGERQRLEADVRRLLRQR